MKILKRGTPTRTVFRGTCAKCETEIEAEQHEVRYSQTMYSHYGDRHQGGQNYVYVYCPVCNENKALWPQQQIIIVHPAQVKP